MKPDGTQISVAVVGATGYVGGEIVRLLQEHPHAKVTLATSNRNKGIRLREKCPWIASEIVLAPFEPENIEADFVFLCQEAGYAMQFAPILVKNSRVIDMAADFRLKPASVYEQWYGKKHTSLDLLEEAVYGLPELVDVESIAKARVIGNPGCYPTASSLALAPLTRAAMITGTPIIDAKSGTSGAGRSKNDTDYLFSELDGNFKAYGVVGHRHTPEIEQNIGCPVRFTPHLLPTARGIHATIYAPIADGVTREDILDIWHQTYEGRKFISILDTGWPTLKQVVGSNRCAMAVDIDTRTGYAVLVSVIDNMIKGAAGQAIQNMNIMSGLPETTGLPLNGIWP